MFVWRREFLNECGKEGTLGRCGGYFEEDWDWELLWRRRLSLKGTALTLEVRKRSFSVKVHV